MGLDLKRIQSYEKWEKRKLLVLHMETRNLDVESCLRLADIPFMALNCEDSKLRTKIKDLEDQICGIVITGSVKLNEELPGVPEFIIKLKTPILGLCYGNEWLGQMLGAKVVECNPPMGEYSEVEGTLYDSVLFKGIDISNKVILTMAHSYMLNDAPKGCKKIASTKLTPMAGFENNNKKIYGLQFHPEKGLYGDIVFKNFFKICRNN